MKRCKYEFQGFKSKASCYRVVRFFLGLKKMNEEFESGLIADLIHERHYWYSKNAARPTRFRKARNLEFKGGYLFEAYFPGIGWKDVSWRKSIEGELDIEASISAALRRTAEPFVFAYRDTHKICERCRSAPTEEIDHVLPEFVDIEFRARQLVSDEEATVWNNKLTGPERWDFSIPDNHPSLQYVRDAHRTAKLMAVCKTCHVKNAQDRKRTHVN